VKAVATVDLVCDKGVKMPVSRIRKWFGAEEYESIENFGKGKGDHDGSLPFPYTIQTFMNQLGNASIGEVFSGSVGLPALTGILPASWMYFKYLPYIFQQPVADLREAAKDALRHVQWTYKIWPIWENCSGAARDAITSTNWDIFWKSSGDMVNWNVHGAATFLFGAAGITRVEGTASAWFVDLDAPSSNTGSKKPGQTN